MTCHRFFSHRQVDAYESGDESPHSKKNAKLYLLSLRVCVLCGKKILSTDGFSNYHFACESIAVSSIVEESRSIVMPKENNEKQEPPTDKVSEKIEFALLNARRIFLSDAVDNETAADIIRKLWYLEIQNPGKPILFVINSPGGSVDSGLAIWDQIKMISSPVTTLVTGLAASMGSILSLCAAPKRRFATPNARIMIHQPLVSGVIQGQVTDLEIQAKEMLKTRDSLIAFYVEKTGKSKEAIERAIDRDTWLSTQEALEFGLLDGIVKSFDELLSKKS